ncbi:MAG: aspartate aminotransferase family protein [Parcubacteria group bacterium]|nr:aspartate aminotransferase family protein [Parcubacteria group bacterium]
MRTAITGCISKGEICVNGLDYGRMTASEIKESIRRNVVGNYPTLEDWVAVDAVDDCTLLVARTEDGIDVGRLVLDFQTMYSVHNFGLLFGEAYASLCRVPALPFSMSTVFQAAAADAIRSVTGFTADGDRASMKSGGAEIIESACHLAYLYFEHRTGKDSRDAILVAPKRNFHGRTRTARSLSSSPSSRIGPLLHNIHHVVYGDTEELVAFVHTYCDDIAAVVLEPVQGEGGVYVPPEEYLPRAREVTRDHDVPLIVDEIQTGFGRTGADFVCEEALIKPDILCGGKAAGGGMHPVSFLVAQKHIAERAQEGADGATWCMTAPQCAAILHAIRALSDKNLSASAREKGEYLRRLLHGMRMRHQNLIPDIRGKGLFVGVDTVFDGHELSYALIEEGIWAKETGENNKTIRLAPPLVISHDELETGVQMFERALVRLAARHAVPSS